ncbi:MAG: hypothetical protein ACHQAY_09500 [Hyphomicrobiales bacterium]
MASVSTVRASSRGMGTSFFIKVLSVATCLTPLALGGCQDVGFEASVPARMAPGVPIAVEAVEGPPDVVQSAFGAAFAQAAANHQVTIVDAGEAARFRLKGYLTADAAQDGNTALTYVWDVFDASNRRAQRVTGVEEMAGDPADPWSHVDDRALQRVAGKSMDGIADFLADAGRNAPPTVAAQLSPRAVTGGAAAGAAVGATGKPLGYLPTQ